jgi:hypothetical protein
MAVSGFLTLPAPIRVRPDPVFAKWLIPDSFFMSPAFGA